MKEQKQQKHYVVTYAELIFIVFVFGVILVALYPKDMLKKQILSEKANYDLSMLYLKNLLKHNPEDESLMLILAKQSLKTGNIDLAIRLLELLHQSKNEKIRHKALLLGYELEKERYFYIHDPKEQQKEMKKLRKTFMYIFYNNLYTDNVMRWYKEAQFLSLPREELQLLKKLLEEEPGNIELLKRGYFLATILHKKEEGFYFLSQLLKYDKKNKEKWVIETYYYAMRWKEYNKAEEVLLENAKKDTKYKNLLADFYLYRKQYNKATKIYIELYKQATTKQKRANYFKKAVASLIGAKQTKAAIRMLKQHENDFLDNKEMRQFIMKNYVAAGDLDAAAAYAEKILQLKYGL